MKGSLYCIPAAALLSYNAYAATLEVGPGKKYSTPSQAISAAKAGDHVLIAAGEYLDCALIAAPNVVIEGAGQGKTTLTDKACDGKAILVASADNITVRNLTLSRARVPDGNGAGIRAEGGSLTVDHVDFTNNQDGILAANLPQASIIIRDSSFVGNGGCEGSCAHGVYVNGLKLLRVERTTFEGTKQGHNIKSRAERTEVIGCNITDGPAGSSSYAIEIPNGGAVVVRDSQIEKGPKSENHTAAVMIGSEGISQKTPEITLTNNSFKVDGNYSSFLVVNLSATDAMLKGNKLLGNNTQAIKGDGRVE
jgi:hypothetical protein